MTFDYLNKELFFCADDFGKNALTNRRIIWLAKRKKIKRVSVMIGENCCLNGLEQLKKSGVAIDLHLVLKKNNESITQKTNFFLRVLLFFSKIFFLRQIKRDWHWQVEKFKRIFNRKPDGINSHEHLHFFPPLFYLLLELANEQRIGYLRLGFKGIIGGGMIANTLKVLNKINNCFFGKKIKNRTSVYLSCLDWVKKGDFSLLKLKNENVEIICHPETDSDFEMLKNLRFDKK